MSYAYAVLQKCSPFSLISNSLRKVRDLKCYRNINIHLKTEVTLKKKLIKIVQICRIFKSPDIFCNIALYQILFRFVTFNSIR